MITPIRLENKTNQSQNDTKKFDVKFLKLHGCYFHGRYIMTTINAGSSLIIA